MASDLPSGQSPESPSRFPGTPSAPSPDTLSHRLAQVETPAGLVDMTRVRGNLERTMAYARDHNLRWRPHVKTHKSPDLARLQLQAGASGLTVATPREAEVMADVTDDLLLAHPPVAPKHRRILELPPSVRVTVALDSEDLVASLAGHAAAAGRVLGVLVEVDVGMGRVGLPDPEAVVRLAGKIVDAGPGLSYRGILFYPGHLRMPAAEQAAPLAGVAARLDAVLEALHRSGLPPEVVSGGSTPTLFQSHRLPGMTEIRAGTVIFHDRDSVALGVGTLDQVAYTVLATVVSTGVPGQAVVDAGSKALARETFRAVPNQGGYGILLDRPDIRVASVSEEHGVLDLSRTSWRPRVGDRVRIVPNHVCVSVNLQDRLLVVDDEGEAHDPPASGSGARVPKVHGLRTLELSGRGRLPPGRASIGS